MRRLRNWNALVSLRGETAFPEALDRLRQLGPASFHNVIVLKCADPLASMRTLGEWYKADPGLRDWLGHFVPVTTSLYFDTPEELDTQVLLAAEEFLPRLAGKRFHVRMHRRGLKGRLSVNQEERRIGRLLLSALENSGATAEIGFEDPDFVVDIETVENRAGVALLDREQLARYPFLPDSTARDAGY